MPDSIEVVRNILSELEADAEDRPETEEEEGDEDEVEVEEVEECTCLQVSTKSRVEGSLVVDVHQGAVHRCSKHTAERFPRWDVIAMAILFLLIWHCRCCWWWMWFSEESCQLIAASLASPPSLRAVTSSPPLYIISSLSPKFVNQLIEQSAVHWILGALGWRGGWVVKHMLTIADSGLKNPGSWCNSAFLREPIQSIPLISGPWIFHSLLGSTINLCLGACIPFHYH